MHIVSIRSMIFWHDSICVCVLYGLLCTCTPPAMGAHMHTDGFLVGFWWVSGAVLTHAKCICSDLQKKWLLLASKAASAPSGWNWSLTRTQLKSTKHCQFLWWRKWSCEDTLLCLLATSTALWDRHMDGWTDYWLLCAGRARRRHRCSILLLLLLLFKKKSHCK